MIGIYNGNTVLIKTRRGVCKDCVFNDYCERECSSSSLLINGLDVLQGNCSEAIGSRMIISNISEYFIISTYEDIYENFCKEFCIRYSKNDNEDICDNKDDELNCPLNFLFNNKNE